MRVHWFAFTVHSSYPAALELWAMFFKNYLGDLVATDRRGRGFEHISTAMAESKLYFEPVKQKDKEYKDYYHIELPGSACDSIHPHAYTDLVEYLVNAGVRWSVTRLDIAWDDLEFTPLDFAHAVMQKWCVTLAKRETLSIVQSPLEKRDNGELGCETVYLGSRDSERFLRVYNKRGGTRLEIVFKDDRATAVSFDLFSSPISQWSIIGKSHLLQYIRFVPDRFVQWHDFMASVAPADLKVSSARVVSLVKIKTWFDKQVSVALSVFYDVWGVREADRQVLLMLERARRSRDRSRYEGVLQLSQKFSQGGRSWASLVSEFGGTD